MTSNITPTLQDAGHLTHPKYRADIDGLRAIAVLSVVGFHAFPYKIRGGFIGVDIFFVISGFLISTIIFGSLQRNSFSFVEFYSRRIKRIFPALLLVLIASFAIGWVVLLADEYKQLGKHIAGGAGFVSNFVLLNESGYFDNKAETKPLLHLWSLGVEEQFYIVWPLLLWFAWKLRFNFLTIAIVVGTISFAMNTEKVSSDAVAVFYSPQTRFWELLVGSVLAYITLYKQITLAKFKHKLDRWLVVIAYANKYETSGQPLRNLQSWAGAVLIIMGVLIVTKEKPFPGYWALLPTIGAVLVISAGPQTWFNRVVLSNRVLVWFGLISFPLYLWHWPLLSFARILESETPTYVIRIIAVLISIALAWLTYILIEKPFRFGNHSKVKTIMLIVLMGAVGCVGYSCYKRDGLTFRTVNKINASLESGRDEYDEEKFKELNKECEVINEEDRKLFGICRQDSRQIPKYALTGDSKAGVLWKGLFRQSTENGRWLVISNGKGVNATPINVLSGNEIYKPYQLLTNIAIEAISKTKSIETVVLVTATRNLFQLKNDYSIEDLPTSKNYEAALDGLNRTTSKLISAGKKIVIVVDNPTFPDPKDCLSRTTSSKSLNYILHLYQKEPNWRCQLDISRHIELTKKYRDLLIEVKSKNPDKIKIFDTTEHLCDLNLGVCLPYKNGHFLYGVTDHISNYAAGLIGRDLNDFLLRN